MVKCRICKEENANKIIQAGNLYGKADFDLIIYLCEDCYDELTCIIEEKIQELREAY